MTSPVSATLKESSWNLYAWGILGLLTFFQIMQWPLAPKFLDIYYHLAVMKGFHDAGGYVTHAFWEYAPVGRPHLYPPLLHIIMLAFYEMGLSAINVGRLVETLSYPLLLGTVYYVTSKLYTARMGLWTLLLASSAYSLHLAAITLSAFNLAFAAGLIFIYQLEKGRPLPAGLMLALCVHTHTLCAGLMCLYALLSCVFLSARKKEFVCLLGVALPLAAPFLIFQYLNRDFFSFVKVKETNLFEMDLGIYALAAATLWSRRKNVKQELRIPIALLIAMTPLIFTHPVRFFYGHGMLGVILLAALGIDALLSRWIKEKRVSRASGAIVAIFLCFSFLAPVFHWNFKGSRGGVYWADRTLVRYLWPDPYRNFRSNAFTIFFPEHYKEITDVIRDHSQKGDIIWTDFSYTAGILGILSDRATSCAMLAEVKPYEPRVWLNEAKIVVWFKDRDLKPQADMLDAVQKYRLELLAKTEMAFIYKNPVVSSRVVTPSPLIPTQLLFGGGIAIYCVYLLSKRLI